MNYEYKYLKYKSRYLAVKMNGGNKTTPVSLSEEEKQKRKAQHYKTLDNITEIRRKYEESIRTIIVKLLSYKNKSEELFYNFKSFLEKFKDEYLYLFNYEGQPNDEGMFRHMFDGFGDFNNSSGINKFDLSRVNEELSNITSKLSDSTSELSSLENKVESESRNRDPNLRPSKTSYVKIEFEKSKIDILTLIKDMYTDIIKVLK